MSYQGLHWEFDTQTAMRDRPHHAERGPDRGNKDKDTPSEVPQPADYRTRTLLYEYTLVTYGL